MSVHNIYNFRESRFTSLSHELRVFIFGADVTPWLKGDLSITYGNRDGFNACSFELSNPRKLWQITRDNLGKVDAEGNVRGIWREGVGEYSESAKLKIFEWKNSDIMNPSFNLDVNSVILGQKAKNGQITNPGPKSLRPTEPGTETRYRLAVNDCIFSRNDPMRIFMRNPYSVKNTVGEWVEIFCGFVHDHPITTNYLTGESTVRISGYCVRQLLTKMRVQINRLVVKADPQPTFDRSFFSDFISPSMAKHPFATTTLEQTIKELILGTQTPKSGESAKLANGIGEFKLGNVICYDPKAPGRTLERWHLMTIFGVNKVPYPLNADDDLWLTTREMESIGNITIDLPEAFSQGPGGRYLHFLLPLGGSGAGALMQSTLDAQAPRTIEWTTRWEIIREFASKLDFQVLTSPSGDILVEFPLYGFTPHVFSTKGGTEEKTLVLSPERIKEIAEANARSVVEYESDIDSGAVPNGLGALLTFDLHQMEDTLNDEAEDFPTILQVDGGMSLEQGNITGKDEAYTNLRAFVYSPVLVSRFGVISEQMSIPFAGQRSGELSGLTDGPVAKRLAKLALIEYMKRLADSSTWDGSVVYRPFLFPNRPVWLKRSARIGLLTSVTNRWSIGKSATTNMSMHMLLSERYDPHKEAGSRTTYKLPTGASNAPIDYQNMWADSAKGKEDSGVFATVGTKNPPTAAANGGAGAVGSGSAAPIGKIVSQDKSTTLYGPKMYKPFSDAIAAGMEAAAKLGMQIQITSTYRDPKKQEEMKKYPENYGVAKDAAGNFVQVAEAWKSCHQYGLAVDIKIVGGQRDDYAKFASLCGDSIYWGGSYGDYVHYEWRTNPPGKTGLQARAFVEKEPGYKDDPDYLTKVWNHFDAVAGRPVLPKDATTPAAFAERALEIIGLGGDRTKSTGTQTATAEPCTPVILPTKGMDKIASS